MPRRSWLAGLLVLALVAAGCAAVRPPVPPGGIAADPDGAWAHVLDRHATEDGRIDFVGLRAAPRDLETYVAWVAVNGPRSTPERFPTPESRLAYWLNAYNAVAMYLVISTPLRPDDLVRFFILTRVRIDGEPTSLYTLENDNRYRDEKIPEDYRVRFIPYDWTLNQK